MEHPFIIFRWTVLNIRLIEFSVLLDNKYHMWSLHLSRLHLAFLIHNESRFRVQGSFKLQHGAVQVGWFGFFIHLCWYPFS